MLDGAPNALGSQRRGGSLRGNETRRIQICRVMGDQHITPLVFGILDGLGQRVQRTGDACDFGTRVSHRKPNVVPALRLMGWKTLVEQRLDVFNAHGLPL